MNHKGFTAITLMVLIFIVGIALVGGYYVGQHPHILPTQLQKVPQSTPQSTNQTTTSYTQLSTSTQTTKQFLKRQFNPTSSFMNSGDGKEFKPYPTELTQIPDSELVGMSCTQDFEPNLPGHTITDPTLQNYYQLLQQKESPGNMIITINFCSAEDGRVLAGFRKQMGNNEISLPTSLAVIQNNSATVMDSCDKVLQLTKDNMLYTQCTGGEGGLVTSSIRSLNLDTQQSSEVISCQVAGGDPISCH